MTERNPLFEDFAKVASSAMNTIGGLRDEAQAAMRSRMESMLADMDLVTREEFEAVRAMAIKAREENEALLAEIESLKQSVKKAPARKPARTTRAASAKKAAPRKTTPRKTTGKKTTKTAPKS